MRGLRDSYKARISSSANSWPNKKGFFVVSLKYRGTFSPLSYIIISAHPQNDSTATPPYSLSAELLTLLSSLFFFLFFSREKKKTEPAMCPKKQKHRSSATGKGNIHGQGHAEKCSTSGESTPTVANWISEGINGGSLRHVDLHTGSNGWASPPGDLFSLRSKSYFTKKHKSPSGDYILSPAGVDWLKSPTKLENVLGRSDNRVMNALRTAQQQGKSLKSFIFAVNLQIPGRDHHSSVFYFATDDPVPSGSLLYKFINGDDSFRNSRFKIVNRIVKGPWIVKATVGNHNACLLGKALNINYHRGENYLEVDVDIGSSAIANAILHLALGYVTSVTIDMGFLVEAQSEEELPEKLIGAVRICQMEMSSATVVESTPPQSETVTKRGLGLSRVNHDFDDDEKVAKGIENLIV